MPETSLTLLLIDDNPDDSARIKAILDEHPTQRCNVVLYDDPLTALAWLSNHQFDLPDCVMVDLHMPQMDGLNFLKALREVHHGHLPVPVILLTGSTMSDDDDIVLARQTLQLGAQDYINKHILGSEWLMRTIHNAIERYALQQEIRSIDEQHRLATDAVNLGTWGYKRNGKSFNCSSRCQDILKLDGNREWLFHDFLDLIYPEDRERTEAQLMQALDDPQDHDFQLEYRIVGTNDEIRWVNVNGRAYEMPDGDVHLRGTICDITDRKKSEQKLIESERFSRSILDSSPDCIMILDMTGRLMDINRNGQDQMQIDDFIAFQNVPWFEMWPVDERHKAIEALHLARQGKSCWFEGFCPTTKKTPKWWEVNVSPIMDDRGRADKILCISRDISDRKMTQTRLQDAVTEAQAARQRAEEASLAKSEFLANMSHEIRTPMNAVIGLANILAISDPLSQKQREFIQTLQLSADSLLSLINDLLDISKIEARSVDMEHVPFSLPQLLQDVISVMSLRAREKRLSFTIDDTAVQGYTYLGDPTRLKQIITNLCGNALKFTHQGGVSITVTRQTMPDDYGEHPHDEICITVKDTGIGIAPDKIGSIFEKFVQADSTINRQYGGTGLGLAITKTLVEMMDGQIQVESKPNEGSLFKIILPMGRLEAEAAEPGASSTVNASLSETSDGRPYVLLVEDYPANILVATMYLDEFGYQYDVAHNGMEAVEKAKAKRYDIIIMDVQMPGMNGFEATQAIRQYYRAHDLPPVPIVGMTAHAMAGDKERCLSAGMDDYITKPFNPDDLDQKLKQAINRRY